MSNLIFSNVELEHIREWSDPHIHQLIVLLQLSAEYLRNIVERVSDNHQQLQRKLESLTEKLEGRTYELEQALEQNELLRRDLRQRRKMLTAYEVMVQAQKEAGANPVGAGMNALATMNGRSVVVKCGHCGKKFISQDHLDNHIARKHVEAGNEKNAQNTGLEISVLMQEVQNALKTQADRNNQNLDTEALYMLLDEQRAANVKLLNRISNMEETLYSQLQNTLKEERLQMESSLTQRNRTTEASATTASTNQSDTMVSLEAKLTPMKDQLSNLFTVVQGLEGMMTTNRKPDDEKEKGVEKLAEDVRFLCNELKSLTMTGSHLGQESVLLQGLLRTLSTTNQMPKDTIPISLHDKILNEKTFEIEKLNSQLSQEKKSAAEEIEYLKSQLAASLQSLSQVQNSFRSAASNLPITPPNVEQNPYGLAHTDIATSLQRSASNSQNPMQTQNANPQMMTLPAPGLQYSSETQQQPQQLLTGDSRIQDAIRVFSDFATREFFTAAQGPIPQPFKPTSEAVIDAFMSQNPEADVTHNFYLNLVKNPLQDEKLKVEDKKFKKKDEKKTAEEDLKKKSDPNLSDSKRGVNVSARQSNQPAPLAAANQPFANNSHPSSSVIIHETPMDNNGLMLGSQKMAPFLQEGVREHSVDLSNNNSMFMTNNSHMNTFDSYQQNVGSIQHVSQQNARSASQPSMIFNGVNNQNQVPAAPAATRSIQQQPSHQHVMNTNHYSANNSTIAERNDSTDHSTLKNSELENHLNETSPGVFSISFNKSASTTQPPTRFQNPSNTKNRNSTPSPSPFVIATAAAENDTPLQKSPPPEAHEPEKNVSKPISQTRLIGNTRSSTPSDLPALVVAPYSNNQSSNSRPMHIISNASSSSKSLPFVAQHGFGGTLSTQQQSSYTHGYRTNNSVFGGVDPLEYDSRRASLGHEQIRGALYDD
eukprot:GDKJ01047375.1.p1 GENE.GDKJ01047375.1~~GDKJ01047375.1.p1  ORF type:complete len:974 (-),score=245.28 GDKJ01047375.1:90-2891(-)